MKTVSLRRELKPEQVTVLIDTREQTPLDVLPLKSQRATLVTGDYSALGLESFIAIERKSLSDLVGCIGRERERFEKEMQRILSYPIRALVIEADWCQIEMKSYPGSVHPNAVLGSLMGWIAQGVPVIMIGDHTRAGRWVSRMIYLAAKRRYMEALPLLEEILEQ